MTSSILVTKLAIDVAGCSSVNVAPIASGNSSDQMIYCLQATDSSKLLVSNKEGKLVPSKLANGANLTNSLAVRTFYLYNTSNLISVAWI